MMLGAAFAAGAGQSLAATTGEGGEDILARVDPELREGARALLARPSPEWNLPELKALRARIPPPRHR